MKQNTFRIQNSTKPWFKTKKTQQFVLLLNLAIKVKIITHLLLHTHCNQTVTWTKIVF